jgi:UDP:flavonoid glycosyltransferase YjiC (YdhE family)
MYRTALDAVADLPVRVLLTTGLNMAEHPLGAVPSNVVVETFVPQALVFPHARAVVTHGGSGTVLGSLGAGVPLVVAPMFADQPDNARAVEVAGAGVAVFDADASSLRSGIETVLASDAFSVAAKRIAAEIGELPGLEDAIRRMLSSTASPVS